MCMDMGWSSCAISSSKITFSWSLMSPLQMEKHRYDTNMDTNIDTNMASASAADGFQMPQHMQVQWVGPSNLGSKNTVG